MAAIFYLILLLLLIANSTISLQMPSTRPFISLVEGNDPIASTSTILDSFRILQLNMLADGLSGLRADFGAFSRVNGEDLKWENRKVQLIYEILQYKPDCITLQECDHYYDFFLPELQAMGYDGLFAPKPSSACLEVSENSDGCAMFLKRDKFRVVSTETITFALAKSDATLVVDDEESKQIRAQNQVALIALCQLVSKQAPNSQDPAPQLIICTTHLKATKNIVGERTRHLEVSQLLSSVTRLYETKKKESQLADSIEPLVLITGDLNAAPNDVSTGFQALAYAAVKASPLQLCSVLNDDMQAKDIWTTWKARRKQGKESIAKSCIDYILYKPLKMDGQKFLTTRGAGQKAGLRARAVLGLFSESEIGDGLLPSAQYPSDHIAIAADLDVVLEKRKE